MVNSGRANNSNANKLRKTRLVRKIRRGAKTSGPGLKQKLITWFRHHQDEIRRSLKELFEAPGSSLMSMTVLAIALALPAGLQVVLKNSQQLAEGLDDANRISLFLHMGAKPDAVQKLTRKLSARTDFLEVELITPKQGLEDFEERSGFGDALQYLDKNPLPYVLVISPSVDYASVAAAEKLLAELQDLVLVDKAQLDLEWVRRLHAVMDLARRAIDALGLLFALAVILIVGNTIRLAIHSHRDEIKVVKLVGATNGFIRRPFLYTGIWFGLGGALLAWFMLMITLMFLKQPVAQLSMAYGSGFQLETMTTSEILILLGLGAGLGWLGSWISVSRHLREIEPG